MRIVRLSEHIWSLRSWMLIPINVWLVAEPDGLTLIDGGIAPMAPGIQRAIRKLDRGPLVRIVLTHGHGDHVGAIPRLRAAAGAVPVFAHALELPYLCGQLAYPRRRKAVVGLPEGLAQPLPVTSDGDLATIGALQPVLTPGHAPGHVVYWHRDDRVLLAGDLFTSKRGKLHRPMPIFTADMQQALHSSRVVADLQPRLLEMSHGQAIIEPAAQLAEYRQTTATRYHLSSES